MTATLPISNATLKRLEAQAAREGCSADTLLNQLLEPSEHYRHLSSPDSHGVGQRDNVAPTDVFNPDEHALPQTEARLRAVLAAMPDLIFLNHVDGTYLDYYARSQELFAVPPSSFLGRRIADVLPPELVQFYMSRVERVIRTQSLEKFEYALPINGATYQFEARMVAVNDEQVLTIVRDITEQRRTQELLNLLYAALEAAANSIVITDRNAHIQWVNPAFTKLTGYSLEEAIGKNPNELVKSGAHDPSFYDAMWKTILAGQVWFGKLVNRRKDGTLYSEEQTITPVYGADGQISHFIAVKQDITVVRS